MYSVYILYSGSKDKYYKGQTADLEDRLRRHNAGYEKSTKLGMPWTVVCSISKITGTEALLFRPFFDSSKQGFTQCYSFELENAVSPLRPSLKV